jgi:hypothetical protein
MQRLATLVLLILAAAGVVAAIKNGQKNAAKPAGSSDVPVIANAEGLPADGVVVTYFTTNVRCPSCLKIEALTRQTVEKHFSEQVRAGRLLFRTVNVDLPENHHFIERYQLVGKTVVVVSRQGGRDVRWVNLQEVWLKLRDEAAFDAYVREGVRGCMEKGT